MPAGKNISVRCPKCGTQINESADWFKMPGKSCPGCGLRVQTERFRRVVEEAEQHS